MSEESRNIAPIDSSLVERNRESGFLDLDDQRRAFCIEYVTNGYKHRDAAESVGFPAERGTRLKREPLVAAYIVDLQNKYLAESVVTKQTLDVHLDELEDIAMGRISIPIVTGSGEKIEAKKFHADLAMKIYAERSKLHGISKDDSKHAAVNVTINMEGMTGPAEVIIEGETE